MTATNANITGNVTAKYLNATQGGIIGGFTIGENYLQGSKFRMSGAMLSFTDDDSNYHIYLGGNPIQTPSVVGSGVILGSFELGNGSYSKDDKVSLYCSAPVSSSIYALWTSGMVRMSSLAAGTTDGINSSYKKSGMIMADVGQRSNGWCMLRVYIG